MTGEGPATLEISANIVLVHLLKIIHGTLWFSEITRNSAETVRSHKIFTPGN